MLLPSTARSGELLRDEILDGATELLPATGTPE
jgi:hypothetical protein